MLRRKIPDREPPEPHHCTLLPQTSLGNLPRKARDLPVNSTTFTVKDQNPDDGGDTASVKHTVTTRSSSKVKVLLTPQVTQVAQCQKAAGMPETSPIDVCSV